MGGETPTSTSSLRSGQPADTYVIGGVAGANVLDSVRAARQLTAKKFAAVPNP